jgi:hypothetical protein
VRLLPTPTHLTGYREIDPYNIALAVIGVSPTWRGVTQQTETASEVTVGVSELVFRFGSGPGDERIAYIAIRLSEPLDGRPVIDAMSGTEIPRILLSSDE